MNFEKLNETSCRIDDIQNGDTIPIGGSFLNKLDVKVEADLASFEKFFQTVEKNALKAEQNEKMAQWFKNIDADFEFRTFAHMYAFDNGIRIMYPNFCKNAETERSKFYKSENAPKLSEAFEKGICQCAELAVLAQAYLSKQGIAAKYFGGELLRSTKDEFAEKHSFITLKSGKKDYVYDPANPMWFNTSPIPRIGLIKATPKQIKLFESKIHNNRNRRNCAFLNTQNIYDKNKTSWYYGCGDGGYISPSFLISQNNKQNTTVSQCER